MPTLSEIIERHKRRETGISRSPTTADKLGQKSSALISEGKKLRGQKATNNKTYKEADRSFRTSENISKREISTLQKQRSATQGKFDALQDDLKSAPSQVQVQAAQQRQKQLRDRATIVASANPSRGGSSIKKYLDSVENADQQTLAATSAARAQEYYQRLDQFQKSVASEALASSYYSSVINSQNQNIRAVGANRGALGSQLRGQNLNAGVSLANAGIQGLSAAGQLEQKELEQRLNQIRYEKEHAFNKDKFSKQFELQQSEIDREIENQNVSAQGFQEYLSGLAS